MEYCTSMVNLRPSLAPSMTLSYTCSGTYVRSSTFYSSQKRCHFPHLACFNSLVRRLLSVLFSLGKRKHPTKVRKQFFLKKKKKEELQYEPVIGIMVVRILALIKVERLDFFM